MPATISPLEYEIELETGERMSVAEFDPGRVPCLSDPEVLRAAAPVLKRCSRIPRPVLESAKMGHSREFEELVGTPPVGCLLRLERPVCAEIGFCASADPVRCTTRYVAPGRRWAVGRFPPCWEFEVLDERPEVASGARALAASVVAAWRGGRVAVLVDG